MGKFLKFTFGTLFFVFAVLSFGRTCLADPTSSIGTPLDGQLITGYAVTVTGAASDTLGGSITKVEVSVNGGDWYQATDTSGSGTWATWSYPLTVHTSGFYQIKSRATNSIAQVEGSGGTANVLMNIPLHSISGTTSYSGTKAGSIYIGVFPDPSLAGGDPVASAGPLALGAYTIPNIPDGTYYVGAVKSAAGTGGGPDVKFTDPFGAYGGLTPSAVALSGANRTGINIALADTSSNPLGGTAAEVEAHYNDYSATGGGKDMQVEFSYKDPTHLASSVTVSGPGIPGGTPISLAWDSVNGQWVSWQSPSSNLDLGSNPAAWPAPPLTYTFTVNLTAGGSTSYTGTVQQYMTDLPAILWPSGNQQGPVIFSWLLVPSAMDYSIELNDGGSFNWSKYNIKGSSYTYPATVPATALTPGTTYYYMIGARNSTYNYAYRQGSFTYYSTTDITLPASVITYPKTATSVGGATCTVTGTASDNAGIQRVEISINNGLTWVPAAIDTSGNGSWSTWAFDWPLAATGSYTLKSRAVDTSNNVQATPSSVTVTVAVDHTAPTSHISAPLNNAYLKTFPATMSGTAADNAGGTGIKLVEIGLPTAPGGGGTIEWTPATGTTSWTRSLTGPPEDGTYALSSRATDNAGNLETAPTSITVTVDRVAPYSSVASPTGGTILKGTTATISGTAGDTTSGVSKVEVSTNGGSTWVALPAAATSNNWATWSYTWTLPADGLYTIKSRATDKAGNVETPGAGVGNVRVDKTAPTVTITSPLTGVIMPKALGSYSISGNVTDAGSGVQKVEVTWDNGANWNPCTYNASATPKWVFKPWTPADGSYTLKARATDVAGNLSAVLTGPTVVVDKNPPAVAITTPASSSTVSAATYAIKGTASDLGKGVTKVELSFNGGAWVPATGTTAWSYSWTVPANGPYTITARATDGAGNTAPTAVSVTVDKSIPTSVVSAPLAGANLRGATYAVKGTAVGGVGATYTVTGVEVSTNGGSSWTLVAVPTPANSVSWSYTWSLPADGVYTILSRAINNAAKTEDASGKTGVTVTVDNTAPASSISAPAADAILTGTSTTITGAASDAGTGVTKVEVSTNGGTTWVALPATATSNGWATWSYTWTLPASGAYTIKSRATDKAGNVETPGDGVGVKVDKNVPTSAITAPLTGAITKNASVTLLGKTTDLGSGVNKVEVSTDGGTTWTTSGVTDTSGAGTWATWSYTWTAANGPWSVKSRATDKAGFVENAATKAAVSIYVDSTPPVPVITTPPNLGTVSANSYVIKGTASDPVPGKGVTKVELSFNGGSSWATATGTTTWSYTWTVLPDNPYTITARATDGAGNTATTSINVTVDRSIPSSTVTAPLAGANIKGTTYAIKGTAVGGVGATYLVTGVEISTDGGANWTLYSVPTPANSVSWSYTWTLPADGVYNILTRAVNNAAKTEDASHKTAVTVTVDNTAPASSISTPTTGAIVKGTSISITGGAGDGTGTGVTKVEVGIKPSTSTTTTWTVLPATATHDGWATWSYTWTLPVTGTYTVSSRATDKAGNVETPGAGVSVIVDKTVPAGITVTTPLAGAAMPYDLASYQIQGNVTDAGSGIKSVQVSWDNGAYWNDCIYNAGATPKWTCTWTPVADGSYTIKVRATDNADNMSAVFTGPTVKVDRTAPTALITAPTNGMVIPPAATKLITGTAADGTGSGIKLVEVSTDGGSNWVPATGTTSWSYNWTLPTADVTRVIKVRVTDKSNNVYTSAGITVTVDAKPISTITSPTPGQMKNAADFPVTITGGATDGTGTVTKVEVSTNGGVAWATATDTSGNGSWSSWSYSWAVPATDGTYTIKSRATDNGAYVETPGAGVAVKVDRTAPTTVISTPLLNAFVGGGLAPHTMTVTGTATDAVSGVSKVEVSIDGSTWYPYTPVTTVPGTISWTVSGIPVLADGPLTILARATDGAGNVQGTATSRAVKADVNLPTVAITDPALDGTIITTSTYTIKGNAVDHIVNGISSGIKYVEISTDGGLTWFKATGTTTWSYVWTITATDAIDIWARAADNAGNTSDIAVVNIAVSPQILNGNWTLTYTPAFGTVKTRVVTVTADSLNNMSVTFPNTCGTVTHYDGLFDWFYADLYSSDECDGSGYIYIEFTDTRHAFGNLTINGTTTYDVTLTR